MTLPDPCHEMDPIMDPGTSKLRSKLYRFETLISEFETFCSGVWENRDPGVEFGLAVHVEPYPGSAMSVWIYVASLVKRI